MTAYIDTDKVTVGTNLNAEEVYAEARNFTDKLASAGYMDSPELGVYSVSVDEVRFDTDKEGFQMLKQEFGGDSITSYTLFTHSEPAYRIHFWDSEVSSNENLNGLNEVEIMDYNSRNQQKDISGQIDLDNPNSPLENLVKKLEG